MLELQVAETQRITCLPFISSSAEEEIKGRPQRLSSERVEIGKSQREGFSRLPLSFSTLVALTCCKHYCVISQAMWDRHSK